MAWRTLYRQLREQWLVVRSSGVRDDAVAQALLRLHRGAPLDTSAAPERELSLRLAWLLFVRAPQLQPRAFPATISLVQLVERRLKSIRDVLDYLELLEELSSPEGTLSLAALQAVTAARGEALERTVRSALDAPPPSGPAEDADCTLARGAPPAHAQLHDVFMRVISVEADEPNRFPASRASVTRLRLGDPLGALLDWTMAVRLSPADPLGFAKRGCYLALLGRKDAARSDFEEALRCAPPQWPLCDVIRAELAALAYTVH